MRIKTSYEGGLYWLLNVGNVEMKVRERERAKERMGWGERAKESKRER
jgi:hypothetical protein